MLERSTQQRIESRANGLGICPHGFDLFISFPTILRPSRHNPLVSLCTCASYQRGRTWLSLLGILVKYLGEWSAEDLDVALIVFFGGVQVWKGV